MRERKTAAQGEFQAILPYRLAREALYRAALSSNTSPVYPCRHHDRHPQAELDTRRREWRTTANMNTQKQRACRTAHTAVVTAAFVLLGLLHQAAAVICIVRFLLVHAVI